MSLDGGYMLWENGFSTDVIEVWFRRKFDYGEQLPRHR